MARKKKHPEHVNHERWLVSYADFITLLFAFFTTLYAISTVDQKKAGKLMYSMRTAFSLDFFDSASPPHGSLNPAEIEAMATLLRAGVGGEAAAKKGALGSVIAGLSELAKDPRLAGRVSVSLEGRGIVISMAEAGFFPSGKSEIDPNGQSGFDALAKEIAKSHLNVTVEGHTDNVPIRTERYASNWELSTARAAYVVHLLADSYGVDPTRLSAAGYGEYKPRDSNDTPEGRARNRRVDIVLQTPFKAGAAPNQGAGSPDGPPREADQPSPPSSPGPPSSESGAPPPTEPH